MKILYHHRIASRDGQYVHIEEIVNALENLGHEVIVVGPNITKNSNVGSHSGWVASLRKSLPLFCTELLEFGYSFISAAKLSLAILKHKPDAIYERYNLFSPAGIWAKKLFQLKLMLEVNSPLFEERNQYGGIKLTSLAHWSEKYVWNNADHICPVSHVLAKRIMKTGVGKENITVIPNGIDPVKFYPSKKIARHARFDNKLILGFVGFCREWHQLDKLLELIATSENTNLMLVIVGDGPAANPLLEQAKQLNIEDKLYITGLVTRQDMPSWLDQIDIALQPAVTPWASPLKLIEYLAKGKAIIAPNSENIKELLTHNKNALLYNMDSPKEALDCVNKILTDDDLRKRLQIEAIKTIHKKKLTWENNANRIESILSIIMSNANLPKGTDQIS